MYKDKNKNKKPSYQSRVINIFEGLPDAMQASAKALDKKKEVKLRKMIREEIAKSLIAEAFNSSKITALFQTMAPNDRRFFDLTAKQKGFAWSDVEDSMISSTANPSDGNLNIFIVDAAKSNPYERSSEWGSVSKGLIGVTIGRKSMYWPKQRWSSPKSPIGNQFGSIDNYKRYSEVADRVLSIPLLKIPSAASKQLARREAQKGATALMTAKNIAATNQARYKAALTVKIAAQGSEGMDKILADATALVNTVLSKNIEMLKQGKYQTTWVTYSSVTESYRRVVDDYVRYKKEFASAERNRDNIDSAWQKEYVASYMQSTKESYQEMQRNAKIVMGGEYRHIDTGDVA